MAGRADTQEFVDYYSVLGIELTATARDIRKAYLKKALTTHPDKNPDLDPKTAEANFILAQKAKDILSDTASREAYNVEYFRWIRREKHATTTPSEAPPGPSNDTEGRQKRKRGPEPPSTRKKTEHHDWEQYRKHKAQTEESRKKSRVGREERRRRQQDIRRQRNERAKEKLQELYHDRFQGDNSGGTRVVKTFWRFPHKRPSSTKKIRKMLLRHGFTVHGIRMISTQAARFEFKNSLEANAFMDSLLQQPNRFEFDATWYLGTVE